MKTLLLSEKELLSILSAVSVAESEKSTLYSALEKRGTLSTPVQYFLYQLDRSQSLLLIFDGIRIFLAGVFTGELPDIGMSVMLPHFSGILGRKDSCADLLSSIPDTFVTVKPKDFRILSSPPADSAPDIPMKFVESDFELRGLCDLRAEFALDDSGTAGDPAKIYNKLKGTFSQVMPAVLIEDGKIIGMMNSHYQSKDVSMVNMVFIKPEYRGKRTGAFDDEVVSGRTF